MLRKKTTISRSAMAVAAALLGSVGIGAPSASAQVSVDLTYQGTLEIDAVPQTTSVTLRMGVFDDGVSVNCLADAVLDANCGNYSREVANISVQAGRFSAPLDGVPVDALEDAVSLGVAVEGTSGNFIVLGVQPLKSVSSSAHAKVAMDGPFAPPVGSIIAWHPAAVGMTVADLPDNWAPCNGGTFNGITTPNLNATGRFLRGGNASGVTQDDAMQGHSHNDNGHTHTFQRPRHFANETTAGNSMFASQDFSANSQLSGTSFGYADLTLPTQVIGFGTPRVAQETRPANMSVIWIMRVR